MLKVLKVIGYLAVGVVGLLVIAIASVYILSSRRLHRKYDFTPQAVLVSTNAAAIEAGHHIAITRGCTTCHGPDLGGAKVIDNPAMGTLYGPNITRGNGGRTANYQDVDWGRAIRHGIGADGHALFLMPAEEYSHFSDDDLGVLIAYLKSVPPVDRASVPISVGPVARALVLAGKMPIAAEVIDHARLTPPVVKAAVTPEYGRYLAVGCTGCHGPNYSGGKIAIGPPDWPPAANLTPDASSRVSHWSEADFVKTLHTGRRPDGSELSPVMPRAFGQMSDDELKAIWAFLKTIPPAATGVRTASVQ